MVDVFFCEAKTACVFRISDWSSDGCSSDLNNGVRRQIHHGNGIVSGIGHEGAPAIAVDDDMGRVVTDRNPSERTGSQIVGVEDDEEALHLARAMAFGLPRIPMALVCRVADHQQPPPTGGGLGFFAPSGGGA